MTYYAKVVNGEVTDIVSSQKDFTQLPPYQQEMWVKMASTDYTAKKRFQLVPGTMNYGSKYEGMGSYGVMIEDFAWWMDNERDILNWMVDNLPQGIEHQQGMFLYFPTEQDQVGFLLRWS
jgi:hypothetical protein